MTGLDPSVDELVEIAVVVTDFELEVLDPGLQIVIKPSEAALAQMGDQPPEGCRLQFRCCFFVHFLIP